LSLSLLFRVPEAGHDSTPKIDAMVVKTAVVNFATAVNMTVWIACTTWSPGPQNREPKSRSGVLLLRGENNSNWPKSSA